MWLDFKHSSIPAKNILNGSASSYHLLSFLPIWAKPMTQRDLLLPCYSPPPPPPPPSRARWFDPPTAPCPTRRSSDLPLSQVLPPWSLSWLSLSPLHVIASVWTPDSGFIIQRNWALSSLSFIASVCLSIKYFKLDAVSFVEFSLSGREMKVGAAITFWQVKYSLLRVLLPFKSISTGNKEWVGYNLSNITIMSEIKSFWCRNNL